MHAPPARPQRSRFADLFTPKLWTVLREGYGSESLRADLVAGLTVAIVALPLAMAIAIASGSTPERGLYTAIIAGFIVAAFGGSRFQIAGPTGAFIVLVHAVIQRHGFDGLVLATFMAGFMLLAMGWLRLGTYINYIPYPVTTGFTAGIAVIILISQIPDLLGLSLHDPPADFLPKIATLVGALDTIDPATVGVALFSLLLIVTIRRWRPNWPSFLIAVGAGAPTVAVLGLEVETIGTRFGGIPRTLPSPAMPEWSPARVLAVLPDAVAIALLAGIECLLSAVVADRMSGGRHRSNCELVAQGGANVASALFGGLPATGAIARTATNIRAGARSPIAGMTHAVCLLLFMLIAAPLAAYVPLASLGAVLAVVAWNMSDARGVAHLLRQAPIGDRLLVATTLVLTVLVDLTFAIQAGVVLAAFLFMHRMAESVNVEPHPASVPAAGQVGGDSGSGSDGWHPASPPDEQESAEADGFLIYRINGPFFFGAASRLATGLDRPGPRPRGYILDFSGVPMIDSTGATELDGFVKKVRARGECVILAAVNPGVRRTLSRLGLEPPAVRMAADVRTALSARGQIAERFEPAEPACSART